MLKGVKVQRCKMSDLNSSRGKIKIIKIKYIKIKYMLKLYVVQFISR